jgi:hypothetical protein
LLIVPEAGKPKINTQADLVSGEGLFLKQCLLVECSIVEGVRASSFLGGY